MVQTPAFIEPKLERVGHSVPRYGDLYAAVSREPAPQPEIVFLGRVTPYKGLSVAIEALALLRSEHGITARLEVVGPEDRDHGAELRRLSERSGVAAQITWHGQTPPEQAAALLARASAMIVPSTWDEPFPLVTIEGALARVPLVASDVGGIGEGMHDEEHALLFAGGDARGAATALARTMGEREQTAARVARAYARAQEFRSGPISMPRRASLPMRSLRCEQARRFTIRSPSGLVKRHLRGRPIGLYHDLVHRMIAMNG